MRAGRAISMLVALQQRGRLTAAQLAEELEVSVRTVLRDVETLSEAGIPVFAVPGAGGGIEVLDGFRTQLTGFTPEDAEALFLAGQPALASALGLEASARAARRKVLQALPSAAAAAAGALDSWFVYDPGVPTADPELVRMLARAARSQVEVRLAGAVDVLRPLGLVLQAGEWWLVELSPAGPLVRDVSALSAPGTLGRRFSRPADFDLARFWQAQP